MRMQCGCNTAATSAGVQRGRVLYATPGTAPHSDLRSVPFAPADAPRAGHAFAVAAQPARFPQRCQSYASPIMLSIRSLISGVIRSATSADFMFSPICSTRDAPVITVLTLGFFRIQPMAS